MKITKTIKGEAKETIIVKKADGRYMEKDTAYLIRGVDEVDLDEIFKELPEGSYNINITIEKTIISG